MNNPKKYTVISIAVVTFSINGCIFEAYNFLEAFKVCMPGKGPYMQFLFIMSFIIYYKNYKHINLFLI
ncbi:hypothetical protein EB796_000704 [Bugula neritina]|uniref:Uncharacterized protein n=1 Tax=Bugula neritina TaxID=10212 RepID=A0A7J7KS65_BUGNE|nr:hypothetical protein EB796_000704 [Bugula neritina]